MLQGTKKSTSVRRIIRKTPGARLVFHYLHKGPVKAKCAKCGSLLHGTPNKRAIDMKRLSKTERRPSRPFGGVLCSKCMRDIQKEKARSGK
jgi:large subunit ribosomal protein L34e